MPKELEMPFLGNVSAERVDGSPDQGIPSVRSELPTQRSDGATSRVLLSVHTMGRMKGFWLTPLRSVSVFHHHRHDNAT